MQPPVEECLTSKSLPLVTLRYPTIPVYGTPASWLSQSQLVTMASNPDDSSCDETSSSLGDSTYDFIDDKSTIVSDDEDPGTSNQSVSSHDGHEVELSGNNGQPRDSTNERGRQPSRIHSGLLSLDPEDSLTTESQSTYGEATRNGDDPVTESDEDLFPGRKGDRQHTIEFQEPKDNSLRATKDVEGSYTLRVFKGEEITEILHHTHIKSSPTQVAATIKQTMTTQGLVLDEPYKVLYVGDPSAKDSIIQKVGSALAATLRSEKTRPSHFNVVPISSFGDSLSPEVVLIDSTGLELSVEECHSASFAKRDGGNDTISMTLSNRALVESYWSGSRFAITGQWKLPDIAIFYLSEDDTISVKQTRRFARSFMSRHTVPCFFISKTPLWNKPAETIALDHRTPHLCLQAHGSDVARYEVVKRLPIDIQTFLSLDARQINRNLACLATTPNGSRPLDSRRSVSSDVENDVDDKFKTRTYFSRLLGIDEPPVLKSFPSIEKILGSGLLLLLGIFLYQFALSSFFDASQVSVLQRSPIDVTATARHPVLAKPTNTVFVSIRSESSKILTSPSSSASHFPVPKSKSALKSNADIASLLLGEHALVPNNSDEFKISVIGDSHIVLRPPHWFIRSRKASKLSFNVSRGTSALSHQVSTLFDGVFAIKIPRDDAYGVLNVSVWTSSRPKINESFEVDFGTSWFRVAGWKMTGYAIMGHLREDVNLMNKGLATICNHASSELRLLVHGAQSHAGRFRIEVGKMGIASLNQTAKTTDIVLAQTLGLSRSLSKKLNQGTVAASQHFVHNMEHLRKDFVLYTNNKSLMASRRVQQLSRSAIVNIKTVAQGLIDHRDRLRATQKRVLKLWWKVRGVPKRGVTMTGPNGKLKARSSKTKKWTTR
ncbi:hypothetical protein MMC07_002135 [Pseudocyphellaria aurata]|nr:hypothetical protein [Pseudocyphellaria aurata]